MADRLECFLLKPSVYAKESLRRFASSSTNTCASGVYHNAVVYLGTVPYPTSELDGEPGRGVDHSDPRWPTTCSCGYHFKEADYWQHNLTRLYWRGDHLSMSTTLSEAPVGAMWTADWYDFKGPDGHCLVVRTPGGDWIVDGPSMNNDGSRGNPWQRSGEIPKVTANPSIHIPGKYHGWLREGFLESC
jgi:hypothetical protein